MERKAREGRKGKEQNFKKLVVRQEGRMKYRLSSPLSFLFQIKWRIGKDFCTLD